MGTVTESTGTKSSVLTIGTLASATFLASSTKDNSSANPFDNIVEVTAVTTNTPTGNKQMLAYLQMSLDNTNFSTGPTSGTTATDEPDLIPLGAVPMSAAGTHRRHFSVRDALNFIPKYYKVVLKNDAGVAMTAGGDVSIADVTRTVA